MNTFLDVIATISLIQFLAMSTNVTIGGNRSVWLSLIFTLVIFLVVWRIWS